MYIVLEFQTTNNVTAIVTPVKKETLNEAESAYHMALAAAAISNVDKHCAMVVNEEGIVYDQRCYYHNGARNSQEEPIVEEPLPIIEG